MTRTSAPFVYRAASLETAACLWEAVLHLESLQDEYALAISDAREAMGSSHLRLTVLGWVDEADKAWLAADGCEDMGTSGQYAGSFDWDFIPGWIMANIDWSNPHAPEYRPSPHTKPAAPIVPDTLATLQQALSFIEGFEGDELQEGIDGPDGLLARMRATVAAMGG